MEEKFAGNESVLKCASLTEESAAKTGKRKRADFLYFDSISGRRDRYRSRSRSRDRGGRGGRDRRSRSPR